MKSPLPIWARTAILFARLIFAAVFATAMALKFARMDATAQDIAAAGIPAAHAAAAYVLFLACVFHGPAHWSGNQDQFGFFVDHFTFIAGLLFAAVYGPGDVLALTRVRVMGPA